MQTPTVGIYHLVRHANGIEPFLGFVRSFRAYRPAGDWRLVLIFKGFDRREDARAYLDAVADLPVDTVHVSDAGIDISSYFAAAEETRFDILVFFNSFCELMAPGWLDSFLATFRQPGVGLVGATGSMESVTRNFLIYGARERRLPAKLMRYATAAGLLLLFPPFPNVHVRTNAFMIGRETFLATRKPVGRRLLALVYESGWWSLTRQVEAMGLRVAIVDRDGRSLSPGAWAAAATFRSGAQDRVLVRDNRVREYADATDEKKALFRELTWGSSEDAGRRR